MSEQNMKKIAGNDYIKKQKEDILIDSVPLKFFLERSTSPIMIFIENKIRDNIKAFKTIFSQIFKQFHCFK